MIRTLLLEGAAARDEAVDIETALARKDALLWVDIQDLHGDPEALRLLHEVFRFHPLTIEDCLFPQRHGKAEAFDHYVFFTAQGAQGTWTEKGVRLTPVELDVFVGRNFLVTVRENPPDLDPFYLKVKAHPAVYTGHLDRLLHGALAAAFASLSPLVEELAARVEKTQERMLTDTDIIETRDILALNRALLELRRMIEPQTAALGGVLTDLRELLPHRSAHLRDLLFHLRRLERSLELYAQLLAGALEVYYSIQSANMNRTVKYLTVLATIAVPPLFVVSYYGMNVPFPEQALGRWALIAPWLAMATLSGLLVLFLRRKKIL